MSEAQARVDLVFLWHHHQPDYRSPRDGRAVLPWVWLHASKDYLDMAARLERHPSVRAAFNFVPSLLDQLDDLAAGAPEALLGLMMRDPSSLSDDERIEIAVRCVVAPRYAFERWPTYRRLCDRAARARVRQGRTEHFGDTEILSLETWFLLAWIDPMFHDEPEAQAAIAAAPSFTVDHRDGLVALHRRLLARVVPEYRALERSGQIELTESPYYHPILPLIIDVAAARRPRPDVSLPHEPFAAPEDAEVHVRRAIDRHERAFGTRPAGMWPAEGSVSPEAVEIFARSGVRWIATDEAVLWGSLPTGAPRRALYRPWRCPTPSGTVAMFFRDHELSDRIGFVYQHWNAEEAAADLLARVRRIGRDHPGADVPVVSVILDGENCWEHYPDDGGPFLEALYTALAADSEIRTRTPSQVLVDHPEAPPLPRLHTGSWINGDFRIWIGHPEKNRAWELLARARRALVAAGPDVDPAAWESLYAAEGSDWFWWLGDDHFTNDKALFDKLFREHLQGVYERAKLPTPGWLNVPMANLGNERAVQGTPLALISPVVDGRQTNFYEWHGAGRHALGAGGGSMHREAASLARELFFGFDLECFYLRLDFMNGLPGEDRDLVLELLAPRAARVLVSGLTAGERLVRWSDPERSTPVPGATCRIGSVLELEIPFASLALEPGDPVELLVHLTSSGQIGETIPGDDLVRFAVPDATFESAMWSA